MPAQPIHWSQQTRARWKGLGLDPSQPGSPQRMENDLAAPLQQLLRTKPATNFAALGKAAVVKAAANRGGFFKRMAAAFMGGALCLLPSTSGAQELPSWVSWQAVGAALQAPAVLDTTAVPSDPLAIGFFAASTLTMACLAYVTLRRRPVTVQPNPQPEPAGRLPVMPAPRRRRQPSPLPRGGATHQGLVRAENQDAVRTGSVDQMSFIVVCDGMGGESGGREAATIAADAIADHLVTQGPAKRGAPEELAVAAIVAAEAALAAAETPGKTTAIVVLAADGQLSFATIGDGALNLCRADGSAEPLLVKDNPAGGPSNMLTAWLGAPMEGRPHQGSLPLPPGATVVAMSDGAEEVLPENFAAYLPSIIEACRGDLDRACEAVLERLVAFEDETGRPLHSDNLTMAMIHRPQTGDPA